jgi:glyoxylase-like metal-dependent hydrolase (beta-lactamase superfamily II)
VLWRRNPEPEFFLARRVPRMRFFGNVFAFCGGRVDPADESVGASLCPADPRSGSLRSTLVRELIEELAIDIRTGRAADPELCDSLRADSASWEGLCDPGSLASVPGATLRLITPDFYPRRFDVWFFLVEVDAKTEADLLPSELDCGGWDSAAGWLERWHQGEFLLAPPTVLKLRVLAAHEPEQWESALRREQVAVEDPGMIQEIRVDPAVRLLALRTPTLPPARHTNACLVGHGSAWLVDPATPFPDEQARLAATLDAAMSGGMKLRGVLLTHHHGDHVGAAEFVSARFGIPIHAHTRTAELLRGRVRVDHEVIDGQSLEFEHADGNPGRLQAVFTPGHAEGHLCFLEPRYGGLIAGDMVSTLSSILIDPADGDMGDYMRSLTRLTSLPIRTVYPAHGPADSRGARLILVHIEHREQRSEAVLRAVTRGPITLDDLTTAVWGDVPRPMLGYAQRSAVSILRLLEHEGRLEFDGDLARPA